jgi:multidrug efflux pump subunit AcrA (membrane-fusion protein)
VRGKRIIFPDEIQPDAVEEEKAPEQPIVVVIGAEKALERVNTARREVARLDAELAKLAADTKRKAALSALQLQYADAVTALEQAQEAERAIIKRMRDDEDFWMLAA